VYDTHLNSKAIVKQLRKAGWALESVRGSHHKFKNPETGKVVIVPHPKKDLPSGTAQAILKQAGLK
jgi:predicted RNA binding protein YcfA (HicA-like mRNA interferase family)